MEEQTTWRQVLMYGTVLGVLSVPAVIAPLYFLGPRPTNTLPSPTCEQRDTINYEGGMVYSLFECTDSLGNRSQRIEPQLRLDKSLEQRIEE